MNSYSEEDFKKAWSETSEDKILHQFYFKHNDLQEVLRENTNKDGVIMNLMKEREQFLFLLERIKPVLPLYYNNLHEEIQNLLDKNQA